MGNIVRLYVGYAIGNACEPWARPSWNFSHVTCEPMVIKLFTNSNKSLWLGSHVAWMITVSLTDTRAVHFVGGNTKILRCQKSNQHYPLGRKPTLDWNARLLIPNPAEIDPWISPILRSMSLVLELILSCWECSNLVVVVVVESGTTLAPFYLSTELLFSTAPEGGDYTFEDVNTSLCRLT